jgi:hypothetical protein
MIDVRTTGIDPWVSGLSTSLDPAFRAMTTGVAAELQDVLAPYPPAPTPGNPWYERGYGTKYRRRDGRITGRKTSESLGRSWSIASRSARVAVLMNKASYGAWVHDSESQTSRHERTGWQTEETAADALHRSGAIEEIAEAAIRKVLKVD